MALFDAASKGDFRAARQAIAGGCAVNESGRNGNTALTEASRKGHTDMVVFLLLHGAAIDRKNGAGETALYKAVVSNRGRTARVLLDFDANAALGNEDGITPLMAAIEDGLTPMISLLFDAAPNSAQAVSKSGDNALSIAVEGESTRLVRVCLDKGLSPDFVMGDGRTPLMLAASRGSARIMELLIAKGARVNEVDRDGTLRLLWQFRKIK